MNETSRAFFLLKPMKTQAKIDENKIEMTEDYDMFKYLLGNRKIDQAHVQKLVRAMRANDLFTPILVNKKMEIIDGQHRLEARRQLKFIVPYYVIGDYGLADVQMLNSQQKNWTIKDYTESYIALGKKDYEIYKWFRERYKLSHLVSAGLLSGEDSGRSSKLSAIFNSGLLKVTSLEEAKQKADLLERIAPYFAYYQDQRFANAFFEILPKKVFDVEKFIRRLENNPGLLEKRATKDQYIDEIEKAYNYRSQNKVGLRYSD